MLDLTKDPLLSKVGYLEKFDTLSNQDVFRGKICRGRIFFEEFENDDLESFTNKILYIGKSILKQYGSTIENNLNEIKEDSDNIFEKIKQKGNYNIDFSAITKNGEEVSFQLNIQNKKEFNRELNGLSESIKDNLHVINYDINDFMFSHSNYVKQLELLDESACKRVLGDKYDTIKKQIKIEKINYILFEILRKIDNTHAVLAYPNAGTDSYITAIADKDNARKLHMMSSKKRENLKKRSADLKDLDPATYHRIFGMKCFM